jgi:hypothetical protein
MPPNEDDDEFAKFVPVHRLHPQIMMVAAALLSQLAVAARVGLVCLGGVHSVLYLTNTIWSVRGPPKNTCQTVEKWPDTNRIFLSLVLLFALLRVVGFISLNPGGGDLRSLLWRGRLG